jgi:hypothetical protein
VQRCNLFDTGLHLGIEEIGVRFDHYPIDETDHVSTNAHSRKTPAAVTPDEVTCFGCGNKGHGRNRCRYKHLSGWTSFLDKRTYANRLDLTKHSPQVKLTTATEMTPGMDTLLVPHRLTSKVIFRITVSRPNLHVTVILLRIWS